MRSIRARRSPAAGSGWTTKGSTGARRKRDFVFMRGYFATEDAENTDQVFVRVIRAIGGSKGMADADEERGAVALRDGIAGPCRAARERQRRGIQDDEIEGELGTGRRPYAVGAEGAVPGVAGVGEDGPVEGLEEDRPRPHAALDAREREAEI